MSRDVTGRVGIIYPSDGVHDAEFYSFAPRDVSLHLTRWPWPDRDWSKADAPDIMAELAHDPEIAACAALFDQIEPSVVTLGCTSVSFAAGAAGDRPVLENIRRATRAKPSCTSTAFAAACKALAVDRVAVAAVYHESITRRFVTFLEHGGSRVVSCKSENWTRDPRRMTSADLCDLAAASDHPQAQAILIPETNMLTSEAIPLIEKRLGKPALTAIQVTVWHAARLAGSKWRDGIGEVWKADN